MFIKATYECCNDCGIDEKEIEKFYDALEKSANNILKNMRGK